MNIDTSPQKRKLLGKRRFATVISEGLPLGNIKNESLKQVEKNNNNNFLQRQYEELQKEREENEVKKATNEAKRKAAENEERKRIEERKAAENEAKRKAAENEAKKEVKLNEYKFNNITMNNNTLKKYEPKDINLF